MHRRRSGWICRSRVEHFDFHRSVLRKLRASHSDFHSLPVGHNSRASGDAIFRPSVLQPHGLHAYS